MSLAGELSSAKETMVSFTVVDTAGKPVILETYLGAFGHLVAFAQSDLAYTHIHPSTASQQGGTLDFSGQLTGPGLHRLFLQFAAGGNVHTAELTINAM